METIKHELIVRMTPLDITGVVYQLNLKLIRKNQYNYGPFGVLDETPSFIRIGFLSRDPKNEPEDIGRGEIQLILRADRSSLLTVEYAADDQEYLEPTWELLRDEIKRLGYLGDPPAEESSIMEIVDDEPGAKKTSSSKTGPRKVTDARKIKALQDWKDLDRDEDTTTLYDFLVDEFGADNAVPNVARTTFYGWPAQLKKKGLLDEDWSIKNS